MDKSYVIEQTGTRDAPLDFCSKITAQSQGPIVSCLSLAIVTLRGIHSVKASEKSFLRYFRRRGSVRTTMALVARLIHRACRDVA